MHWQPFDPADLRALMLQKGQAYFAPMLADPDYGADLQRAGPGLTLRDGEHVLICGGIVTLWEGRAMVWSLISRDAGKHFIRIYRAMRLFLELHSTRRIEAAVDVNFPQAHRLARMLGFEREGTMRAYQGGRDVDLYARVV